MRRILYLLIVLIMIGCSSLPKHRKSDLLLQADRYFKSAQQAERQLLREQALYLYDQAYSTYSRIDHLKGKIHSGIGISRQYHYLGQEKDHQLWADKISLYIDTEKPQYSPLLELMFIEIAFSRDDYDQVLLLSRAFRSDDLEWNCENLCYGIYARIKQKQTYYNEKTELQNRIELLAKLYNKGKLRDPVNYSYALYTLGYISRFEGTLDEAASYFDKAKMIDIELENSVGLADDLYALGKCYQEKSDPDLAKSYFSRAYEIYLLIGDEETALRLYDMISE